MRSPFLGLVMMSVIVSLTDSQAIFGMNSLMRFSMEIWKFQIGMNGSIEKRKIMKGNTERKTLNEIADALTGI